MQVDTLSFFITFSKLHKEKIGFSTHHNTTGVSDYMCVESFLLAKWTSVEYYKSSAQRQFLQWVVHLVYECTLKIVVKAETVNSIRNWRMWLHLLYHICQVRDSPVTWPVTHYRYWHPSLHCAKIDEPILALTDYRELEKVIGPCQ